MRSAPLRLCDHGLMGAFLMLLPNSKSGKEKGATNHEGSTKKWRNCRSKL